MPVGVGPGGAAPPPPATGAPADGAVRPAARAAPAAAVEAPGGVPGAKSGKSLAELRGEVERLRAQWKQLETEKSRRTAALAASVTGKDLEAVVGGVDEQGAAAPQPARVPPGNAGPAPGQPPQRAAQQGGGPQPHHPPAARAPPAAAPAHPAAAKARPTPAPMHLQPHERPHPPPATHARQPAPAPQQQPAAPVPVPQQQAEPAPQQGDPRRAAGARIPISFLASPHAAAAAKARAAQQDQMKESFTAHEAPPAAGDVGGPAAHADPPAGLVPLDDPYGTYEPAQEPGGGAIEPLMDAHHEERAGRTRGASASPAPRDDGIELMEWGRDGTVAQNARSGGGGGGGRAKRAPRRYASASVPKERPDPYQVRMPEKKPVGVYEKPWRVNMTKNPKKKRSATETGSNDANGASEATGTPRGGEPSPEAKDREAGWNTYNRDKRPGKKQVEISRPDTRERERVARYYKERKERQRKLAEEEERRRKKQEEEEAERQRRQREQHEAEVRARFERERQAAEANKSEAAKRERSFKKAMKKRNARVPLFQKLEQAFEEKEAQAEQERRAAIDAESQWRRQYQPAVIMPNILPYEKRKKPEPEATETEEEGGEKRMTYEDMMAMLDDDADPHAHASQRSSAAEARSDSPTAAAAASYEAALQEQMHAAATCIQAHARGYLAQRHVSDLREAKRAEEAAVEAERRAQEEARVRESLAAGVTWQQPVDDASAVAAELERLEAVAREERRQGRRGRSAAESAKSVVDALAAELSEAKSVSSTGLTDVEVGEDEDYDSDLGEPWKGVEESIWRKAELARERALGPYRGGQDGEDGRGAADDEVRKDLAATRIQAAFRGLRDRRAVEQTRYELERAQSQIRRLQEDKRAVQEDAEARIAAAEAARAAAELSSSAAAEARSHAELRGSGASGAEADHTRGVEEVPTMIFAEEDGSRSPEPDSTEHDRPADGPEGGSRHGGVDAQHASDTSSRPASAAVEEKVARGGVARPGSATDADCMGTEVEEVADFREPRGGHDGLDPARRASDSVASVDEVDQEATPGLPPARRDSARSVDDVDDAASKQSQAPPVLREGGVAGELAPVQPPGGKSARGSRVPSRDRSSNAGSGRKSSRGARAGSRGSSTRSRPASTATDTPLPPLKRPPGSGGNAFRPAPPGMSAAHPLYKGASRTQIPHPPPAPAKRSPSPPVLASAASGMSSSALPPIPGANGSENGAHTGRGSGRTSNASGSVPAGRRIPSRIPSGVQKQQSGNASAAQLAESLFSDPERLRTFLRGTTTKSDAYSDDFEAMDEPELRKFAQESFRQMSVEQFRAISIRSGLSDLPSELGWAACD
ncbi:unnamed protein product [Pedinophyceae sp. YPF-701]|nr:unnamed protein product [Pedinophyceae sp. YPF-701]